MFLILHILLSLFNSLISTTLYVKPIQSVTGDSAFMTEDNLMTQHVSGSHAEESLFTLLSSQARKPQSIRMQWSGSECM